MTEQLGEIITRKIPGVGTLTFENLAAGEWTTLKGEPGKKARRRYLLEGRELDSVSSIVDTLDKYAVRVWVERQATLGAVQAERLGELHEVPEEDWVGRVKSLNLGATAKAEEGADRGKAIHDAFHSLALTGEAPNPAEYPVICRPWIKGAMRAWLAMRPQPIASEQIVCHSHLGYAGRFDLLAKVDGKRTLIDYKTGKGRVFEQAHYQTRGYVEALWACHETVDRIVIVGIADDGGFELVDCAASPEDWAALLHTYRSRKRINAAMAAQRKAARELEEGGMTTAPYSFDEAKAAIERASRAQQKAEHEIKEAFKDYGEKERAYRQALAVKITELRADGVAATTCIDLAKGDERVALLRFRRDVAEGVKEAVVSAIWRHTADRRELEQLVNWSLRVAPDGQYSQELEPQGFR